MSLRTNKLRKLAQEIHIMTKAGDTTTVSAIISLLQSYGVKEAMINTRKKLKAPRLSR